MQFLRIVHITLSVFLAAVLGGGMQFYITIDQCRTVRFSQRRLDDKNGPDNWVNERDGFCSLLTEGACLSV